MEPKKKIIDDELFIVAHNNGKLTQSQDAHITAKQYRRNSKETFPNEIIHSNGGFHLSKDDETKQFVVSELKNWE